jgi:hypothetical protein
VQHFGSWLLVARGKEWLVVIKRLGPFIVGGGIWGAIGINPWRTDEWKRGWMMITAILLVLFVRSIVVQVQAAKSAKAAAKSNAIAQQKSPQEVAA